MPRPVGNRIKEACEIVESNGPCGYSVIAELTGIQGTNASKYCVRAVSMGLMVVEKPGKRGQKSNFAIYKVTPDWRDKLATKKPKEKPKPVIKEVRAAISFVFDMGAR